MATLSHASEVDIRSTFDIFDADQSGLIDQDEFLFALRALGWAKATDADVRRILTEILGDGNAAAATGLTFDQFALCVRKYQRPLSSQEEASAAFKLFDRSGKHKISASDLRAIGEQVTGRRVPEELIDDIMRVGDLDRDGTLSFDEFFKMVSMAAPREKSPDKLSRPDKLRRDDTARDSTSSATPFKRDATGSSLAAAPAGTSPAPVKRDTSPKEQHAEPETIAGVKVFFDAQGKIGKTAVRAALRQFGYDEDMLSEKDYDDLFRDTDTDEDGLLSRHEYCTLLVGFGETIDGY